MPPSDGAAPQPPPPSRLPTPLWPGWSSSDGSLRRPPAWAPCAQEPACQPPARSGSGRGRCGSSSPGGAPLAVLSSSQCREGPPPPATLRCVIDPAAATGAARPGRRRRAAAGQAPGGSSSGWSARRSRTSARTCGPRRARGGAAAAGWHCSTSPRGSARAACGRCPPWRAFSRAALPSSPPSEHEQGQHQACTPDAPSLYCRAAPACCPASYQAPRTLSSASNA